MAIEVTPAVVATKIRTEAVTLAYEQRGDPPVTVLVAVHTYSLLDDEGNVVAVASVGAENPAFPINSMDELVKRSESAVIAAQGVSSASAAVSANPAVSS